MESVQKLLSAQEVQRGVALWRTHLHSQRDTWWWESTNSLDLLELPSNMYCSRTTLIIIYLPFSRRFYPKRPSRACIHFTYRGRGNRTHNPGFASVMLYQQPYRTAVRTHRERRKKYRPGGCWVPIFWECILLSFLQVNTDLTWSDSQVKVRIPQFSNNSMQYTNPVMSDSGYQWVGPDWICVYFKEYV